MAEQTEPVEVLTLEQYQQAKQRGKNLRPGTLVLVPASLLNEMQARMERAEQVQTPHNGRPATSLGPDVVEMTYVGQYTQSKLWLVKQGQATLATLKREIRTRRIELGDIRLSFDEAINILERSQSIQKTTKELTVEMAEYQIAIANIEREPDAYVLPEIARDWYEQQIERVRPLLQAQAENGAVAFSEK